MCSSDLASSGGNVTAENCASVTERGVCWSTSPNPTILNSKTVNGSGSGSFSSSLTGLLPGVTYYLRAYATNSVGTGYGNEVSFTTVLSVPDVCQNILYVEPSGSGSGFTPASCTNLSSALSLLSTYAQFNTIQMKGGNYTESASSGGGGTQTQVGYGTSAQGQPFYAYWDYTRSAALYTSSDIGRTGTIATIDWYVNTAKTTSIPIKIYIKTTASSTLTADTWANMISGATLVYNSSRTFNTTGWYNIDISNYTYSSNNLLILVEANIGTWSSDYPTFNYSSATSCHQYWYQDDSAPTGNGSVNSSRPNVQLNFTTALPGAHAYQLRDNLTIEGGFEFTGGV